MIPTKRDNSQASAGTMATSRDRLTSLFAGFSLFGTPTKSSARPTSSTNLVPISRSVSNTSWASGKSQLDPPDLNVEVETTSIELGESPRVGLLDLPDELIIHILSFLPTHHVHLLIARRINRRLKDIAESPQLWTALIDKTPGPQLSKDIKARGTSTRSPGLWSDEGTWEATQVAGRVHYPTLYRARRLLDRVVRGPPLACTPHIDLITFPDAVYCIHLSGPWLIIGGRDKSIQVWRTSVGNNVMVKTLKDAHQGSVLAISVDADTDGCSMVTGSSDDTAGIWKIKWGAKSGQELRDDPASTTNWKVDITRTGTLRGHTAAVLDVALAKDTIVTCSKDTSIRIYDRHTHNLLRVANLHTGPVNCLALHPDPDVPQFVSASGDGSWVLSHMHYPMVIAREASDDTHALACIAWKGPYIVTGSKDCDIRVYTSEGYRRGTFIGHRDAVRAIDLDVNEAGEGTVISGSYDHTVHMWDIETSGPRQQFRELHTSIVLDVQYTNGRMVTASHDKTVRIMTFGADLPYRDLFV